MNYFNNKKLQEVQKKEHNQSSRAIELRRDEINRYKNLSEQKKAIENIRIGDKYNYFVKDEEWSKIDPKIREKYDFWKNFPFATVLFIAAPIFLIGFVVGIIPYHDNIEHVAISDGKHNGIKEAVSSGIYHTFVRENQNLSEQERVSKSEHPPAADIVQNFHDDIQQVFDKNPNASEKDLVSKIQELPVPPRIKATLTTNNLNRFGQNIYDIAKKDSNPFIELAANDGIYYNEADFVPGPHYRDVISLLIMGGAALLFAGASVTGKVKRQNILSIEKLRIDRQYDETFGLYSPQAIKAIEEAIKMEGVKSSLYEKAEQFVNSILEEDEKLRQRRAEAAERKREQEKRERAAQRAAQRALEDLAELEKIQKQQALEEERKIQEEANRGVLAGGDSEVQDVVRSHSKDIQDVVSNRGEDKNKKNVPGQAAWVVLE